MSKEKQPGQITPPCLNEVTIKNYKPEIILGLKHERTKTEEDNLKGEILKIPKFEKIQPSNTVTQFQIKSEELNSSNKKEKINFEQKNKEKKDLVINLSENFSVFQTKETLNENNKSQNFCSICKTENNNLCLLNEISSSKLFKKFLNEHLNMEKDVKNIISLAIDKIFFNLNKLQNKDNVYVCENCIWKEFISGGIEKLLVLFNKDIAKINNKNSILDLKEILFMNTKIIEKISLINKNCKTAIISTDAEIKALLSNLDKFLKDLNVNNLLLNKFIENYETRINNFFTSNTDDYNKNDFINVLKNINVNDQQISDSGNKNKNKFEINLCHNNNGNSKNKGSNFPIFNKPENILLSYNNLLEEKNVSINLIASKIQVGNRKPLYAIFTKNIIHEVHNEKYPKNCQAKIFQTDIFNEIKKETSNKFNINSQKRSDYFNIIKNTKNGNNEIFDKNNIYLDKEYNKLNNINLSNDGNFINSVNNITNLNNANNMNNISSFNENSEKLINNSKNKEKIYNIHNENNKNIDCNNNNINGNDINSAFNKTNNDFNNNNNQGNQFKDVLVNYLISSLQLNQKLLNQITNNYKINNDNNNNYNQKNDLVSAKNNILHTFDNRNTTNVNRSPANNLNQRDNNTNISLNSQNEQDQNNNSLFIGNFVSMKNNPNMNNYLLDENNNQCKNINKLNDDYKKYNNKNIPRNENFMYNNFNKTNEQSYISSNNNFHTGYNYINNIKNNTNSCYNNKINGIMNLNNSNNNMLLTNQMTNNLRNNENSVSNSFNNIFNPNVYPSPVPFQKLNLINKLNRDINTQNFNLNINSQKNNIPINTNINNNFNMNNKSKNNDNYNMIIKNDSLEGNNFNAKTDLDNLTDDNLIKKW